jgi:hypothetical protein
MINLDNFALQLDRLMTWFNTSLTEDEISWLYQSLNSKLDDEQFQVACQIIFDTKSKGYPGNFPCVNDFVVAVQGTIEDQALKQWSLVAGKVQNPSSEDRYVLSALGKKALDDIGGIDNIRMGQVADMVWHEKRFIAAYVRVGRVSQRNNVALQRTGRSILELNGSAPKQLPGSAD